MLSAGVLPLFSKMEMVSSKMVIIIHHNKFIRPCLLWKLITIDSFNKSMIAQTKLLQE